MDPTGGLDVTRIIQDVLPNAGVAGALALVMFHFYRRDATANRDMWKGQSEMLLQVVKENTAAIVKLTEKLTR